MANTKKLKVVESKLTHEEVVQKIAEVEASLPDSYTDDNGIEWTKDHPDAANAIPVQWTEAKPNTYVVAERFCANVNNRAFAGKPGEVIELTPTEYNVVKRFIKE